MTVRRQGSEEILTGILNGTFIGFDQLLSKFDLDPTSSNFPPYDIEKINDTLYRVTLAVAGFKQNQLEITSHEGTLTITGTKDIEEEMRKVEARQEILHKGIASRSFERKFTLGQYMEVSNVELADGLLVINIELNVPESAQPKKFEIK